MYHRHDMRTFQPAAAELSRNGHWQIAWGDYDRAIYRGHYLRSQMFRHVFAALGRAMVRLVGQRQPRRT